MENRRILRCLWVGKVVYFGKMQIKVIIIKGVPIP